MAVEATEENDETGGPPEERPPDGAGRVALRAVADFDFLEKRPRGCRAAVVPVMKLGEQAPARLLAVPAGEPEEREQPRRAVDFQEARNDIC